MASGLSLKVLLQLNKKQFDQGINSVKKSIEGLGVAMKRLSAMFIGGFGLASLVSKFKETATDLSVVKATLENVTDSAKEYGQTLDFIRRIADAYGQDMISLANGYAKFHAAAKQTNLTLEQQKDIFEALTRAAGAYHLSAERTELVMLAVEQMLSKGNVRSEELRRQLGDHLPGAFNLMAKAAGIAGITLNGTTQELNDALQVGKVDAEKVLPYFAQMLNAVTSAANFDSLQSSLNRFKNAWVDFVDKSQAEGFFKGLTDFGVSSLKFLGNNFNALKVIIKSTLAAILAWKSVNIFQKLGQSASKNLPVVQKQLIGIRKELENTKYEIGVVNRELDKLQNKKKYSGTMSIGQNDIQYLQGITAEERQQLMLLTQNGEKVNLILDKQQALLFLSNKKNGLLAQEADLYGKLNMYEADSIRKANGLNAAWLKVKATVSSVGKAIGSIGINILISGAISLMTSLWAKTNEAKEKAKELADELEKYRNLHKDLPNLMNAATAETDKQIAEAKKLYNIATDINESEINRKYATEKLSNLLSDQSITFEEIENNAEGVNQKLQKWSENLKKAARSAAAFKLLEKYNEELIENKAIMAENEEYKQGKAVKWQGDTHYVGTPQSIAYWQAKYKVDELEPVLEEIEKIINDEGLFNPFTNEWGDASAVIEIVKGKLDSYKASVAKLDEELKKGIITQKMYDKRINKLRYSTQKEIEDITGWETAVSSLDKEYQKLFDSLDMTVSSGGKAVTPKGKINEALDKYKEESKELENQFNANAITGDELSEELAKLTDKTYKAITSFDDFGDIIEDLGEDYVNLMNTISSDFRLNGMRALLEKEMEASNKLIKEKLDDFLDKQKKYKEKAAEIMEDGIPKRPSKETGFFAYKDGLDDTLRGYAKDANDYVKALEKLRDKLLDLQKISELDTDMQAMLKEVVKLLKEASIEAEALTDAANFAELAKDIEKLNLQLDRSGWEAYSNGLVGGFSKINSSLASISEILEGDDWEDSPLKEMFDDISKAISVLQSFNSIMDAINSTLMIFNNLSKTQQELDQASIAMTKLKTGTKVEGLAAETVAEQVSAAATQSSEAAKQTAIQSTTTALAGQAVAGAAASQASIPFVGPLLAAAAVAGIIALLSYGISKFANGGFVGGNSYSGDNQLVRANSGEMILNPAQQRNLLSFVNGRTGNGGGKVEFEIRGDRLRGVLNNYESKRRG